MQCSGRLKGRLQKLLLLEALAVGALVHGGVGLVRTDLDGVQTAVLGVLTVVGAVGHGAANRGVGRAGAAVIGMIGHRFVLLKKLFWRLPRWSRQDLCANLFAGSG